MTNKFQQISNTKGSLFSIPVLVLVVVIGQPQRAVRKMFQSQHELSEFRGVTSRKSPEPAA